MNVADIAEALNLKCYAPGKEDCPVSGGYVGDLLSWVIGRAGQGSAWITIMSNVNVAAVGLLADVSMIILAEDVIPDDDLLDRAQRQGLGLYSSPLGAYELSCRLHELID